MLYVLVWFGCLKQILCLFAPHMDLQKIDEIKFDNTKYNVLKPTIHLTRDHFKDFVQQRSNGDFPGRKVFVDRNGIRHYWTGFEPRKPKSLRKAISETNNIPFTTSKKSIDKRTEIADEGKADKLHTFSQLKFDTTKKPEMTKKVKNKPQRKRRISEPDDAVPINKINKLALREEDGKTKVKTTFFCPFFGVVTMVSYI